MSGTGAQYVLNVPNAQRHPKFNSYVDEKYIHRGMLYDKKRPRPHVPEAAAPRAAGSAPRLQPCDTHCRPRRFLSTRLPRRRGER
eukprot:scaffold20451_cov31-Phaeocystis_antarctica.AAC.3